MQNEGSFFENSNRCSQIIRCHVFSNLRMRGVIMSMKKIIIICAVLVSFLGHAHSNATGADPNADPNINGTLPEDFPEFIITQNGETAPGYLIGSVSSTAEGVGSYFMVLENSGKPVFYSKTQGFGGLVTNGLFASRTEIKGMKKKYTWFLKDETATFEDTFQMGNGYLADNHDFQLLPNGHALMLCYDTQIIDMSQIVEGGHPNAEVIGSVIQELDVHKNVIFQWRSWDHIPITDSYQKLTKKKFDYIHVNSIELDELDGNIILSCRETSEVIKISRVTGEVMWRMGGKHNEFTFINEHEENAPRYFKVQHDARRHPNGNLTIFDNGADKNDKSRQYSRGVEYALDEENKTATMVWEFRHDPDIVAMSGGNVIRLPNGNSIIRWGGAAKLGEAPAATEVDPNGQLVYEIWPAQEGVTGGFTRSIWPFENMSTTVTHLELMEGNTYIFDEDDSAITGVTIKVNSYEGQRYNEAHVKKEPFAPLYPEFPGKAPVVLPVRVHVAQFGIDSINARISFDAESFGFTVPDMLTIYHREFAGHGLFIPLPTSYNPVTRQLRTTMTRFGEFIFCYPDLEEVPFAPILLQPQDQGSVNPELPVFLEWTPRGFARSYRLQVATDCEFDVLLVDEPYLTETRYTLETVEPGTPYCWRVCTTNEGGTSQWSASSFETVPPMVQVTVPNGGEQWQRGLEVFILWNDNLSEDVVIELYKGDSLLQIIGTTPSTGAYQWEVGLDLEPGSDYSIKVKSSADEALFDMSDNTFTIN